MTSLSRWDIGGLLAGFQCNSMIRLAMRDMNAIICFCLELRADVSLAVPKIANSRHGWKLKYTEDIVLKKNMPMGM